MWGGGASIPFNKLPGGVRAEEEGGGAQQRPGFAEQWGRDEIGTRRGLLQAPGQRGGDADGGDAPTKTRTS